MSMRYGIIYWRFDGVIYLEQLINSFKLRGFDLLNPPHSSIVTWRLDDSDEDDGDAQDDEDNSGGRFNYMDSPLNPAMILDAWKTGLCLGYSLGVY